MKNYLDGGKKAQFPCALVVACLVFASTLMAPMDARAAVSVDQQPLTVSNNVPGNLVLTPSVEWPTVMSMSNLDAFSSSKTYGGYFDPTKCYTYDSTGNIPTGLPAPQMADPVGQNGYFKPTTSGGTGPATCTSAWSGNYLNWAATQTIDTFRSVMTGGYRVVDTSTTTVLEKARHTGQNGNGDLSISGSSLVPGVTPANFKYFYTRLKGLGNKMYFVAANSTSLRVCDSNGNHCANRSLRDALNDPNNKSLGLGVVAYTGQDMDIKQGYVYSVNVDVLVCSNSSPETNCVQYGSNYKPEGLIQKYSKSFKYSVFGYLNIDNENQDGAAMRAQQEFVGPYTYDPVAGVAANPAAEWDASTGVLVQNPDATDAAATNTRLGTSIADSGVINYINKFGEMYAGSDKSHDPVSEMYYAAIRYLKGQAGVSSYSDISKYGGNKDKGTLIDGFPVITVASDPIVYSCQKNFILGIGDANTWDDKNLPGNTVTASEPSVPAEVSNDATVDVTTALSQIATLEGISIPTPFTGRNNSAYIAALAYDSHTKDMRPTISGKQTVSTFWVDVEENAQLFGMSKNQYLLATKYGGFTVPSNYNPYSNTTPFPLSWWSTTGDMLTTSGVNEHRPDNFFEGGNAASMRNGLNAAFSAIASQNSGSNASLSLNSTKLENGSKVFQASYVEGQWTGALNGYDIDPTTKTVSGTPSPPATLPVAASRKVYTVVGGSYKAFNSTNVSGNGWDSDTVNYVLGDSSGEIRNGGSFRNRSTALGDIIDSQPVYVGAPNPTLFSGATFTGSSDYNTFATGTTVASRPAVVYVAANDGMIHGFNASTGVEIYAFMPGAVLSATKNPSILAQANYGSGINPHQDFNDGELTVADAYFNSAWHTVLVGTTGRGLAKSIYALDVTDPTNVKFLWEYSGTTNSDIGQILGKPVIAQTKDGWVVLVGNGYNSTNGTASLLSIPLDSSNASSISVYTTDSSTDNGLGTPGVWIDVPANDISTVAYAGDLKGNLWSFDLGSSSKKGKLVFTTQSSQPITAPIALGKDSSTGHLWAFFGTGQYLSTNDLSSKATQSWYGIIADGNQAVKLTDLVHRKVVAETAGTPADPNATPPTTAVEPARAISSGTSGDMSGKSGWYMNLLPPDETPQGERMLVSNQFAGGYLIGATLIPDTSDPCAPGGRGWVMAVNPFTGTGPSDVFFDLNHDASFDNSDRVSSSGSLVAAGGIGFSSLKGMPSFAGALMLNNLNGVISTTLVNPAGGKGGRVSWREIVH